MSWSLPSAILVFTLEGLKMSKVYLFEEVSRNIGRHVSLSSNVNEACAGARSCRLPWAIPASSGRGALAGIGGTRVSLSASKTIATESDLKSEALGENAGH